jgi:hypothetical protein
MSFVTVAFLLGLVVGAAIMFIGISVGMRR